MSTSVTPEHTSTHYKSVPSDEVSFERNLSYLDFKVKFSVVQASNSAFAITATVSRDNQTFPNVKIKNLPKLDGLKAKEDVIELLKAQAIDYVCENIYFLSTDPLETYLSWVIQVKEETDLSKKKETDSRIQFLQEIASKITREMKKNSSSNLCKEYIILGDGYFQLHFYLEAILCYQKGYLVAKKFVDLWTAGNALGSLGNVYEKMGDFQRALNFHQKHLAIANDFKNVDLIGKIHINIVATYTGIGNNKLAMQHLVMAREHFEKTKNIDELIKIYNNLGNIYDAEGKFIESIQMYNQVITLTSDPQALGMAYINLGSAHNSLGNYKDAIHSYTNAIDNYKVAGIPSADSYGGLGNVYQNLGQYLKSIRNHQLALKIYQNNNERSGEGIVYCNLANAYDALSIVGTVSDVLPGDTVAFSTQQELRQHYKGQAVAFYEKAQQIAQNLQQSQQFNNVSINLAEIYYGDGDLERAFEYCLKILPNFENNQNDPSLAAAYKLLALICINLGELEKAETYFLKNLEIYEKTGMQLNMGHAHTMLGNLYRKQKNYQNADSSYTKAIDTFSRIQNQNTINDIQHNISFFETVFRPYRLLEMNRLEQLNGNPSIDDHGKIIPISDSGRARALVSILNKKLGLDHCHQITLDQIKLLTTRLKTALVIYSCDYFDTNNGWCWVVSPEGTVTYRSLDLTLVLQELDLKSEKPNYLRGSKVFIDDLERSSDTSNVAAALSHYLSADNFVIRGNPGVESTPLKEHVTKIWYQALVKPIIDLLPREEGCRVTIVPDSSIHQLPFAIFTDDEDKALIDKFTLITIPSIEALLKIEELERKQQDQRQRTKACIVANPDQSLKGAEEEGTYAADLFQEPIFLPKDKATKKAVIDALPSVGYIHLACHGAFTDAKGNLIKKDRDSVFQGALDLFDDQLFADDIIDIPLNVDCAILNACESGKGYLCKEGVVGLSHALLGAGASTVIATKWTVPDKQACEIIKSFYQHYFGKTEDLNPVNNRPFAKAEALRNAMLDMKKKYPANIKAWGGFFLIGLPG